MPDTKTEKYSLFALEHKQLGDVHVELGARVDHQKYKLNLNRKIIQAQASLLLPLRIGNLPRTISYPL